MYLAYPKLTVGTASRSSSSISTIRSAHEPKAAGEACQQMAGKRARATLGREPSVLYLVFPPPLLGCVAVVLPTSSVVGEGWCLRTPSQRTQQHKRKAERLIRFHVDAKRLIRGSGLTIMLVTAACGSGEPARKITTGQSTSSLTTAS
jgi:hypothetical protein